jgi:alcohol dehydrogenase
MSSFDTAERLLYEFKGSSYLHGLDVLPQVGQLAAALSTAALSAAALGRRAILVSDRFPGSQAFITTIKDSLAAAGVTLVGETAGAAPNCPRQDLFRIAQALVDCDPEVVLSFGGGSTIDAAKAAEVLRTLGGSIDDYFGTGLVSQALQQSSKRLAPHIAIQTAASSAAHLTKYSNITDLSTGQKKLIVDNAIVPPRPVFDYRLTFSAPAALTADGALDGVSHALEVLYSAVGKPEYAQIEAVAAEAIRLVVQYLPRALADPGDAEARLALGLATDLGGYAIMLGGTNGAHLTSFSLVDILSHGRACGLLNPYYTVFFAPAVQAPLQRIGQIYRQAGYTQANIEQLSGRALGLAVAEAMLAFEQRLGFPTTLGQVPGFSTAHIERALAAAKNPQLKMKLENMPVPMTAEMVDEYMGPILQAAASGDLSLIKTTG